MNIKKYKTRKTTEHSFCGFTILEILIAIVIVGLLTAIASYNLIDAREKAVRTQCRGNLRTLYEAVHNYCQEHLLPPGTVVTIDDLHPIYYNKSDSGYCPATHRPYQSTFTNGIAPVCTHPQHDWSPDEGLKL